MTLEDKLLHFTDSYSQPLETLPSGLFAFNLYPQNATNPDTIFIFRELKKENGKFQSRHNALSMSVPAIVRIISGEKKHTPILFQPSNDADAKHQYTPLLALVGTKPVGAGEILIINGCLCCYNFQSDSFSSAKNDLFHNDNSLLLNNISTVAKLPVNRFLKTKQRKIFESKYMYDLIDNNGHLNAIATNEYIAKMCVELNIPMPDTNTIDNNNTATNTTTTSATPSMLTEYQDINTPTKKNTSISCTIN